jgi:hypothetical protein
MRLTARTRIIAGALSIAAIAAPAASARVGPGPHQRVSVNLSTATKAGPNAPPILRVARASELAAINRAEVQREAARSYSPPAGARYSSADTAAYLGPRERVSVNSSTATQGGPVGPPILRVARASELAAIDRVEAQRQAALSYSPPAGARYSSADTDAYAAVAHPVASRASTVKAPGEGFDYGAAAVGAGLAAAIIVLIAAGGLVVRRRRQPQYG